MGLGSLSELSPVLRSVEGGEEGYLSFKAIDCRRAVVPGGGFDMVKLIWEGT